VWSGRQTAAVVAADLVRAITGGDQDDSQSGQGSHDKRA
jgi:hypothetical protein